MVGVMAKPTITKSCSHDKVVTENKPCNAGINKIQDKNRTCLLYTSILIYRVEFSIPLLKQYERAYNPIYPLRQLDNTAMIFIFLLTANSWLII